MIDVMNEVVHVVDDDLFTTEEEEDEAWGDDFEADDEELKAEEITALGDGVDVFEEGAGVEDVINSCIDALDEELEIGAWADGSFEEESTAGGLIYVWIDDWVDDLEMAKVDDEERIEPGCDVWVYILVE
jgi:hypothetical protein